MMATPHVRAIRRAMRDHAGELRDVALERMRHAMRRDLARLERAQWH